MNSIAVSNTKQPKREMEVIQDPPETITGLQAAHFVNQLIKQGLFNRFVQDMNFKPRGLL